MASKCHLYLHDIFVTLRKQQFFAIRMCHFWHVIALVGYEKQTNTGVRGKNREKNLQKSYTQEIKTAANL